MTSSSEPTQRPPKRSPRAKKSLGQNFLADKRVVSRIVNTAQISSDDTVLEIGPGRGAMTRLLAERAGRLIALELDTFLAASLTDEFSDSDNVSIIEADAREVDIDSIIPTDQDYKLVANLPYYAASPIIRRFLEAEHKPTLMVVMVQREVARNMTAQPGDTSILSIATQLYGKPRIAFSVPPRAFRPPPNVTSAVVRIDVYPEPVLNIDSTDRFFDMVRAGFGSRRKQIHNSLDNGLDMSREAVNSMLEQADIDPKRRAQTLSMDEWGRLYDSYRAMSQA